MRHHTIHPDQVLGERYVARERIATGGMGEVWRAEDNVLHREVACKILKNELADDPDCRARFLNEARTAAALHHPGIASVFDFGEQEGEPPFLVMELVEGETLTSLLRQGSLGPERARDIVAQVATALAEAHRLGMVHRDVKPGNILVQPDGLVKLTDFGIARAADAVALTKTGEVIGTPTYLSPEQAEGRTATVASDVYALGVVLYECLTGIRPFVADSPVATALAHIREPMPELPASVPADLADVTARAMAKDPDDRFPDGAAMAAALQGRPDATQLLTMPPAAAAAPAPVSSVASRWADRLRGRWPLVAMLALALLLLLVLVASALNDSGGETGNTPPGGNASPSPSVEPRVTVDPELYLDKPLAEVRAALKALGLTTKVSPTTEPNPGGHQAGTVADLSPNGRVLQSRTITLTVWAAVPPPASDDDEDDEKGRPDDKGKPGDKGKSDDKGGD